jgi:hypothetical protein
VAGADSPQSWRKVLDAPAQELTAGFYDKTELQMGDKNFGAQESLWRFIPWEF